MVFRMVHVKDSLLPMGKVWSLDFQGLYTQVIDSGLHLDPARLYQEAVQARQSLNDFMEHHGEMEKQTWINMKC